PATTPAAPTTAHVDDIKEVVNKPVSPHGIKATIEPEAPSAKPLNQPAGVPREAENLPRVSSASRQGGNPPATVPAGRVQAPEKESPVREGPGRAGDASVERAGGRAPQRSEPARSGGSSPAPHPPAQRERRGADGTPVESPA